MHFQVTESPAAPRQGAEAPEQPHAKRARFLVINLKHTKPFAPRHKLHGPAGRRYHAPEKHRPPSSDGCGRARCHDVTSAPAGAGQPLAVAGPGQTLSSRGSTAEAPVKSAAGVGFRRSALEACASLGVGCAVGLSSMDPFLALLNSLSASLSGSELHDLKFLCQDKIGKRKLESVQSGRELFNFLMEQQLISSHNVDLLKSMFKSIKRDDLILRLEQFIEEGEASASDERPDMKERRLQKVVIEVICENVGRDWKMLMRKLDLSDVKMDRIVAAYPHDLREQLVQSLREWQKWKGKDAKVTDLIKALRDCNMNLVADIAEQKLSQLTTENM
uniref:FAS-associated death domain protein n=1 Tax=Pavo cristatus TaxID=9049 RepID=A0A8C9F772_PAVCR